MTHDEILDELAKRGLVDGNIAERLSAAHRRELEEREHVAEEHATEHAEAVARDNCRDCVLQHPYHDFGGAGVATVHHFEVRETVAGRWNLVATFTDPHRAAEYAERIAREGGAA